jgi:hypothetical protein
MVEEDEDESPHMNMNKTDEEAQTHVQPLMMTLIVKSMTFY